MARVLTSTDHEPVLGVIVGTRLTQAFPHISQFNVLNEILIDVERAISQRIDVRSLFHDLSALD